VRLGKKNQKRDRLIEFCKERNLIMMNTMFEQPKRRISTKAMSRARARYKFKK